MSFQGVGYPPLPLISNLKFSCSLAPLPCLLSASLRSASHSLAPWLCLALLSLARTHLAHARTSLLPRSALPCLAPLHSLELFALLCSLPCSALHSPKELELFALPLPLLSQNRFLQIPSLGSLLRQVFVRISDNTCKS